MPVAIRVLTSLSNRVEVLSYQYVFQDVLFSISYVTAIYANLFKIKIYYKQYY
jgi:hypothetical protein